MCPPRLDAVGVYDIVYMVLMCLRPAEIVRVRPVCLLWADACDHAIIALVSPVRAFSPFFRTVLRFRSVMAAFNVIASGSRILQLFDPFGSSLLTESSGLDLFVEQCDAYALEHYLKSEGYVVAADSARYPSASTEAQSTAAYAALSFPYRSLVDLHRRFVLHVTRWSNGDRIIDVSCTAWTPIIAVLHFACTADMNFMTWDGAFCFFPKATLIDHVAAVLSAQHRNASRSISKCEWRGFTVLPWQESQEGSAYSSLSSGCRWLGSGTSWSVALPVDGVPSEGTASERIWRANGATLSYSRAQGPRMPGCSPLWVARLDTSPLEHPALSTHTYAVSPSVVTKFMVLAHHARVSGEMDHLHDALPRLLAWCGDGDGASDPSVDMSESETDSDLSIP